MYISQFLKEKNQTEIDEMKNEIAFIERYMDNMICNDLLP